MNTKFDFNLHRAYGARPIVYVRKVDLEDLPAEVRAQVSSQGEAGEMLAQNLYAVHNTEGERLALVQGRALAFVLARQHDMAPVTVH